MFLSLVILLMKLSFKAFATSLGDEKVFPSCFIIPGVLVNDLLDVFK